MNGAAPLSIRTVEAQEIVMDPVRRTAESIAKIISFLLFRVPQKQKRKFLSRIRGKIVRLPAGQIGLKQMPPSAAIGQAISLTKNILAGLNPFFVKRVLDEVGQAISRVRDIHFPTPPPMLPQVGKGRRGRPWGAQTASSLPPLSKRAFIDVIIEPLDPAVQAAVQKIKMRYPGLLKQVERIKVHPGGGGQLGHVESGPGKNPREIHIFKGRIDQMLHEQLGHAKPTPQAYQEALERAIVEVIGHEAGHIGEHERPIEQQRIQPFFGEGEAEAKARETLKRVFPAADDEDDVRNWIQKNVRYPHGNCFFYSAALAALFPNLKLMKGRHSAQHSEDTAHFWVEDSDGTAYDPTACQYSKGKLLSGKEVSVENNLDHLIEDPLFSTLTNKDRKKIRLLADRYTEFDQDIIDMEQNLLEPTPSDLQFNTENQGYSSGPGSLTGNPYGIRAIPVANEGGGR